MVAGEPGEARRMLSHEARQSLNAIRLTTGNLRLRLGGNLEASEEAYLLTKLEKIDRQVDRLSDLLEVCERPLEGSA